MAAHQARQWGVTPAISLSLPTDAELAANDALIAELKRQNNFESVEETERRYNFIFPAATVDAYTGLTRKTTLQSIQKITVEFVRQVSKKKGLSQAAVDAAGGKIFTYGSYRLGVYGPGRLSLFENPHQASLILLQQVRTLTHLSSFPNMLHAKIFSKISLRSLKQWLLPALSKR